MGSVIVFLNEGHEDVPSIRRNYKTGGISKMNFLKKILSIRCILYKKSVIFAP